MELKTITTEDTERILYCIALIYEYKCEMYDRNKLVAIGKNLPKTKRVKLVNSKMVRTSNKYAYKQNEWVEYVIVALGKTHYDFIKPFLRVKKLSFKDLEKQYKLIDEDIFSFIKSLSKKVKILSYEEEIRQNNIKED